MKDAFLEQDVTEAIRTTESSSSILDLFSTSNPTLINKVEIIPGISDHEAVFVESSLGPIRVKAAPRKVYQHNKADYDTMMTELKDFRTVFDEGAETKDVENLWQDFKRKLHSLMDTYIPSKQLRGNKVKKLSLGYPNK